MYSNCDAEKPPATSVFSATSFRMATTLLICIITIKIKRKTKLPIQKNRKFDQKPKLQIHPISSVCTTTNLAPSAQTEKTIKNESRIYTEEEGILI